MFSHLPASVLTDGQTVSCGSRWVRGKPPAALGRGLLGSAGCCCGAVPSSAMEPLGKRWALTKSTAQNRGEHPALTTVALPNGIFHMLIFCVAKETVSHQLQIPALLQGPLGVLLSHFSPQSSSPMLRRGDQRGHHECSWKQLLFSGQQGPSARRVLRKREGSFPLFGAPCQVYSHSSCSN